MHLKPSTKACIKLLLLIGMLLPMACNGGIKVEHLILPSDVLEDGTTVFVKDSNLKLSDDFAQIDAGATIGDGFVMAEATDAERIKSAITHDKHLLFIRIPEDISAKEHIFKSLTSAALRLKQKTFGAAKLYHLNIASLNREISAFKFNHIVAKSYYLNAAKKLNEQLKDQDGLIINLDDLRSGTGSIDFLKLFSRPTLVVLSSQSMDALKLTEAHQKAEEFFPSGLNIGQVYSLALAHFKRSKALSDPLQREAMAIKLAKTLGAMDPGGSLEDLGRLLKKIDPIINTLPLSPTFEESILKTTASDLRVSQPFLVSLGLFGKSMTEIQRRVEENRSAYTEETTKRDETLALVKKLLPGFIESGMLGLKRKLEQAIADSQGAIIGDAEKNKSEVEDSLGEIIKKIGERGESQITKAAQIIKDDTATLLQKARDQINEESAARQDELGEKINNSGQDIKDFTKDKIAQAQSAINSNSNKRITESQNNVIKEVKNRVLDAQTAINDHSSDEMARAFEAIDQTIQAAVRRMAAEGRTDWTRVAQELRDNVAQLVRKAREQINDHTTLGQEELGEKISSSGQDVKDFTKDKIAQAQTAINSNSNKRITDSQNNVIKEVKNRVLDAQTAINDHSSDEMARAFEAIDQAIQAAVRRMAAAGRTDWTRVAEELRDNVAQLVRKAREQINDHTTLGQEELGEKISVSGQDVKDFTKDKITQAQSAINSNSDKRIADSQRNIVKEVKNRVLDAQTAINDHSSDEMARAFEAIDQAIQAAVRRMAASGRTDWTRVAQELRDNVAQLVRKAREQINDHTTLGQEELAEKISSSGQDVKDFTKDKIAQAQSTINSNSDKRIADSQRNIVKEVKNRVLDAQTAINDHSSDEMARAFEAIDQAIQAAVRRMAAAGRTDWTRVAEELRDNVAQLVRKAREQINEHTTMGQEELREKISVSGQDVKDFTKDKITQAQTAINSNSNKRIEDSQGNIIKEVKNRVLDAQTAINDHSSDEMARAFEAIDQAIQAAVRRMAAAGRTDWTRVAQELRDNVAQLVRKAREQINDHTTMGQEELGEKIGVSGQDLKDFTKDKITQAQTAINSNSNKRIADSQRNIVKEVKNRVLDAQNAINDHSSDEMARAFEAIDQAIQAAVKKMAAAGKADWAKVAQELKESVAKLVQKARDQINEQTVESEAKLGEEINSNGQDIKDFTKDRINKSQSNINSNTNKRINDAQNTIVNDIKAAVTEAQENTEDKMLRAFEALEEAIKQLDADESARLDRTTKTINNNTNVATFKSYRRLSEALNEAVALLQEKVEDDGTQTREDLSKAQKSLNQMPATIRVQTRDLLRQLGRRFKNNFVLFSSLYQIELDRALIAANQNPVLNQERKIRLQNAARGAAVAYEGQVLLGGAINPNTIRNAAVAAYRRDPAGVGAVAAEDVVSRAIGGADNLLEIVNNLAGLENIQRAPRPLPPSDEVHEGYQVHEIRLLLNDWIKDCKAGDLTYGLVDRLEEINDKVKMLTEEK